MTVQKYPSLYSCQLATQSCCSVIGNNSYIKILPESYLSTVFGWVNRV
jgi:hypothetical protein